MSGAALVDFDRLWDYGGPAATEARLRELLPAAEASDDRTHHVELLTQIARAQGLQGKFAAAEETLAGAWPLLDVAAPRARVRWLLERGRVRNSSGCPEEAVPLFRESLRVAEAVGEDYFAVDAAHMLAIAEPPDRQLEWHRRAIALAEASADPGARGWLGALFNNLGWTLHDAGEFDQALAAFERALAWREERAQATETRIARWAVGRCLRSLGRVDEALAIQRRLRAELDAAVEDDPYVDEELRECLRLTGQPIW